MCAAHCSWRASKAPLNFARARNFRKLLFFWVELTRELSLPSANAGLEGLGSENLKVPFFRQYTRAISNDRPIKLNSTLLWLHHDNQHKRWGAELKLSSSGIGARVLHEFQCNPRPRSIAGETRGLVQFLHHNYRKTQLVKLQSRKFSQILAKGQGRLFWIIQLRFSLTINFPNEPNSSSRKGSLTPQKSRDIAPNGIAQQSLADSGFDSRFTSKP